MSGGLCPGEFCPGGFCPKPDTDNEAEMDAESITDGAYKEYLGLFGITDSVQLATT
jgi:hypothetical protein